MSVHGVKRSTEEYEGSVDSVSPPEMLHESLAGARLVVIAVALTEQIRSMIGADELAAASDDAVVVTVSRGPVLDAHTLLDALGAGDFRTA
jgi:phosphoglycerate dehydrogenase-like enzyme